MKNFNEEKSELILTFENQSEILDERSKDLLDEFEERFQEITDNISKQVFELNREIDINKATSYQIEDSTTEAERHALGRYVELFNFKPMKPREIKLRRKKIEDDTMSNFDKDPFEDGIS